MGCDVAVDTVADDSPYFLLAEESFFGAPILAWHDCSAPGTCDESVSLFGSFVSIGGVWKIRNSSSSGGADSCSLGLTDGSIEETEAGIRIEIRSYRGTLTVPTDDDCQPETAEARQDELTCESLEVIEATRL